MKGRITTVLSLTGVLVAGSAAALINTQVLQSTDSESGGGVVVASSNAVDTTVLADTTTTSAATDTSISGSSDSGVVLSSGTSPTQALYQVGSSGVVTLDTSGGILTIVSVTPSPGWTLTEANGSATADIAVKFQSATTRVEFKAHLSAGLVTTSVEAKLIGSTGTKVTTPSVTVPGSGTIDDDHGSGHDDDEHEEDDD